MHWVIFNGRLLANNDSVTLDADADMCEGIISSKSTRKLCCELSVSNVATIRYRYMVDVKISFYLLSQVNKVIIYGSRNFSSSVQPGTPCWFVHSPKKSNAFSSNDFC